jgi:hypothetical protein
MARRQRYSNMNHTTKPVPAPLPPCYICEEEITYCENNRGDIYQCTGCYFDEFGEVYMAPHPSGMTSSLGVRENCPTSGWNSDGLYVTTNAPSSSGGTSPTGGGISLQQARPTRPKKKRKEMGRAKKLKASGCGCGSNFSGDRKPCTCGRNPGGSCQCNNSNASGRRQTSEPCKTGCYDANQNCVPCGGKQTSEPCKTGCFDANRNCVPCGGKLKAGQTVAFPHNASAKKYDMLKFNNYVSKIKTKKQMNFVNPTKYGAGEDDVFAFNPRVVEQFSTNSKGFLDKADLDNYSF